MWGGESFGDSTPYSQMSAPRFLDWSYFNTDPGGRGPDAGP
jgi:hypothetical protein